MNGPRDPKRIGRVENEAKGLGKSHTPEANLPYLFNTVIKTKSLYFTLLPYRRDNTVDQFLKKKTLHEPGHLRSVNLILDLSYDECLFMP